MTIEDLYNNTPKEEEKETNANDGGYDYSEAWQKEYPTKK